MERVLFFGHLFWTDTRGVTGFDGLSKQCILCIFRLHLLILVELSRVPNRTNKNAQFGIFTSG